MVLAQCRCPSDVKTITIVKDACPKCHGSPITLSKIQKSVFISGQPYEPPTNPNWEINKDGVAMEITYEDMKYLYSELHDLFHGDD